MPTYKITTVTRIDVQPDNIVPELDSIMERLRKIGLIANVEQVVIDKEDTDEPPVSAEDGDIPAQDSGT